MGSLSKFKGEICVIFGGCLWGIISLFTLPLSERGFSSASITFARSLIAAVALLIFILMKDRTLLKIRWRDLPLFICLGTVSFFFVCVFHTYSISMNGSAVAAVLEYTSIIWTVIVSRFLFKEKITLCKILSVVGVLGGCVLLSLSGEIKIQLTGIVMGLLTGMLLSSYGVIGKVCSNKRYEGITVTFYAFLFSAAGGFFMGKGWELPTAMQQAPNSLWCMLGLGVFSTALAYLLYNMGLMHISAGKAGMLSTIEIIVAALAGLLFYDKNPGFQGFLGIAVTIASLVFMQLTEGKTLFQRKLRCTAKTCPSKDEKTEG